ncbi:ketopantoate reductase family protein [Candidatus Binatia bacterium]|nr:ketopantoate reductase family protein [Candidatus Binatia bacterium]
MRILIAGAGALGSVLGAFLRCAGDEVTLLGRAAHLDAIAAGGLFVEGIWGDRRASGFDLAYDAAQLRTAFDAIVVAVKAYDTEAVASAVAGTLRPDGVVLSLQNGLGNAEILGGIVGPQRVLAARVIFGAEVVAAGRVRVTVYAEPVLVGAWPPADARRIELARAWAQRIDAAGIPAAFADDIAAALWGKVLYNAALNPLGALLGVHYGALGEHDDTRAIMDRAIEEAFSVATAEGVRLPWPSAEAYREAFYARLLPATFHHRSSMLQDLERRRRTEVDAISGEVWRRGRLHGIGTPVSELLTRLVRACETVRTGERA